jgi:AraC-like DNA-binding protein
MSTAIKPFSSRQIPSLAFRSDSMRPGEALAYWQDSLCPSWDLHLDEQAANESFHVRTEVWRMNELLFGYGVFGPTQVRCRRERNFRADQMDHYRLILLRQGRFDCDAGERQTSLRPGRFVITDMARAESNVSCSDSLVLFIPREQLDKALPRPMDVHGLSPDNPCAQLLQEHLSAMLNHLPEATLEEIPGLSRATVSLVAASLASSQENLEAARPALENVLLRRGRRFIERHLRQDNLGAPHLCTEMRISRSTLYRVFSPVGGVSQYIKERRLARIHESLASGLAGQSISRLAEQFGFKSAAHFSTAFREQYGYSAREVAQRSPTISAGPDSRSRHARLHGWLGELMQQAA